jgi:hypothetical protein
MSLRRFSILLLSFSAIAAVLAAGCPWTDNPNYCPGANPNDNCSEDQKCTSNDQCSAPTAVCDVGGTRTCVQCTMEDASACTGVTPACGEDHACHGCTWHAQCGSNACLPDGSCGDNTTVAYVDPAGTDNPSCTREAPCTKVSSALATGRPYVKLTGTTDEAVTVNNGRMVSFVAEPGAKLTTTNNGSLLRIDDSAQLHVYDLEISGALGANVGIVVPAGSTAVVSLTRVKVLNNAGGGISVSGGTLVITQSLIAVNTGGGVSITNAQFDITNTVIAKNGGPSAPHGGLLLSQTSSGTRRFAFNTVAQNQAMTGITPGAVCAVIAGLPLKLTNSIVYDNSTGAQVEGNNCSWTYSDIGPTPAAGMGNINAPPMFVDPLKNNFHLQAGSPALRAADPSADLTGPTARDIDGDARTSPADIGADEVP